MPGNSKNKKEEKMKNEFCTKVWKIFFWEAFLFSLTLGMGIAAAFRVNKVLEIQRTALPQISPLAFVLYFAAATLFVLFLSYSFKSKKRKDAIFKILFISAVFFGSLLFFEIWLPKFFSLFLVIILIFWWWKKPLVLNQNILMVLGMAGIGATLGLFFPPLTVVVFLIVFSIYDFIAVYKTKHMVKMAREMTQAGAILGLIVPSKTSDFKAGLRKFSFGGQFLVLGGGDVVFPLILCASLVPWGFFQPLIVAFFAVLGLAFSFYLFNKKRQPIPALPPIALFSIIGYLITFLF